MQFSAQTCPETMLRCYTCNSHQIRYLATIDSGVFRRDQTHVGAERDETDKLCRGSSELCRFMSQISLGNECSFVCKPILGPPVPGKPQAWSNWGRGMNSRRNHSANLCLS